MTRRRNSKSMEGLAEIYRSQSLQSTNVSEKSGSTLSLKKIFGKKPPKTGSKYSFLGSQAESVNSYATTASRGSNTSQKSNQSTSSTDSTGSTISTASKSSKWSYKTDRFTGPKNVPKPSKNGNKKSKDEYYASLWSQAYTFGGR